jgi:NAD(P)-dependent dehydrogenase (short-subunit alcohol dehydrogenase family)
MPLGDFPLKDKILAVTGAGSGINLSFAKIAVAAGAKVLVADLKLTTDGELFIESQDAKSVVFVNCDVTKRKDLENIVTESQKLFGDVPDAYVAGAGVFDPVSCLEFFIPWNRVYVLVLMWMAEMVKFLG